MLFFFGTTKRLFIINVMTTFAYAFILPIMSLYLINEIHARPFFITVYSMVFALSGLFFSQLMGSLADSGYSIRRLYMISVSALFLGGLSFIFARHPIQAMAIGIFLMGPGNASVPLLLSMIRRHSMKAGLDSTRVNIRMRSGVSIVWIIGPSLAFVLANNFGFTFNFMASALLSGITLLVSYWLLPKSDHAINSSRTDVISRSKNYRNMTAWILGVVMVLASLANNLYLTIMPLYMVRELHLPASFPGYLLSTTAVMEIPVMLCASHLADKMGKDRLFIFGLLTAILYYGLLQMASSMPEFLILQLLNSIFFGIFVGLGLTLIQDAFPERSGYASAFYSSAITTGMLAGNGISGLTAQFVGFKTTLLVSLLSVTCAALLMLLALLQKSLR